MLVVRVCGWPFGQLVQKYLHYYYMDCHETLKISNIKDINGLFLLFHHKV